MLITYRDKPSGISNLQHFTAYSVFHKARELIQQIKHKPDSLIILSNTAFNDLYNKNKKTNQKPQPQDPPEPESHHTKGKRYL
jgi:hypothetical protein